MTKKEQDDLLIPKGKAQEIPCSMETLDLMIDGSPHATFVQEATLFKMAFREGDELIRFCSDRASWRACMGSQGYAIRRKGVIVRKLVMAMN